MFDEEIIVSDGIIACFHKVGDVVPWIAYPIELLELIKGLIAE